MTVLLNRNRIFCIGLGIIFVFLLLNRLDFIIGTTTTTGLVRGEVGLGRGNKQAKIQFETEKEEIIFYGETNMKFSIGEKVNVIYKVKDPTNAKVYTFEGFWLLPILYCILPIIILAAASFSFLKEKDIFVINTKNPLKIIKTTQQQLDIEQQEAT